MPPVRAAASPSRPRPRAGASSPSAAQEAVAKESQRSSPAAQSSGTAFGPVAVLLALVVMVSCATMVVDVRPQLRYGLHAALESVGLGHPDADLLSKRRPPPPAPAVPAARNPINKDRGLTKEEAIAKVEAIRRAAKEDAAKARAEAHGGSSSSAADGTAAATSAKTIDKASGMASDKASGKASDKASGKASGVAKPQKEKKEKKKKPRPMNKPEDWANMDFDELNARRVEDGMPPLEKKSALHGSHHALPLLSTAPLQLSTARTTHSAAANRR
jgi:hypothetical protein